MTTDLPTVQPVVGGVYRTRGGRITPPLVTHGALYQELDPCTGMPRCDGVILTDEIAKADAPQKRVKRKVWLQIYNDASLQVRSSSEHAAMMSNSAITCRLCLDIDIPECTGLSEEFVVEVRK